MSVWVLVFTDSVMTEQLYKYPRLYLNARLCAGAQVPVSAEQSHYLKTVLRKGEGAKVRVFNGMDGEWLARIERVSKKSCTLIAGECLRAQPENVPLRALYFAPIKKQRLDFLVEKAVELGVSDFYPVLTNRTENRKLNMERMRAHVIEAAEQCERMDVPALHDMAKLPVVLAQKQVVPLVVALEREESALPLSGIDFSVGAAFLIGPEGGFDDDEARLVRNSADVRCVALGPRILRAETAALACLSYVQLSTNS